MADEIGTYQAALRNRTEVEKATIQVIIGARVGASALERWWTAQMSQDSIDIPKISGLEPKQLSRKRWPAFDEIKTAIVNWQRANDAVLNAWNALSTDQRLGMMQPDKEPSPQHK